MTAKRKKPKQGQTYEQKIAVLRARYLEKKNRDEKKHAPPGAKIHQTGQKNLDNSIPGLISKLANFSHEELVGMFNNYMHQTAGKQPAKVPSILKGFREALSNEWKRRYEHFLLEGEVAKWPTTDAPYGGSGLNTYDWPDEGMLKFFRYHVGETSGASESARRQILDEIFSLYLPPINDASYMKKWGLPKALPRLQSIAETIAAFVRNAKRRPNMETACEEWESDLAYLFLKYRVEYFGLDLGRTFNDILGWQTGIDF